MPGAGAPEISAMPEPMPQGNGNPSFTGDYNMMDGEDDMGGMPPMDDPMGAGAPNDYEADFDAGVEANEETDPKKYIQQLTGKLSQSLRKYNEGLPQPDADLDKYVAGMVVKQCIEGLGQEDVQDILKKIDSDEEEEMPMDTDEDMNMENPDDQPQGMGQEDPQTGGMPPMNESAGSRQSISNRYEELTGNEVNSGNDKVTNNKSYHKRPWTGKTFK